MFDSNFYGLSDLILIRDAALACHEWADLRDDTGEPITETEAFWGDSTKSDYLDTIRDFVTLAGGDLEGLTHDQIGHDFALTRNRHGAGFWDRGLGERGDRLTEVAQSFGGFHVFLSDTNEIEGE